MQRIFSLASKKTPSVIFSREAKSPAVFGLFRPVLVLPREYFDHLTREQAEHVLHHELCHIKRGDLWVHWFCILLQIVYWFNPLLILARRQLGHVSEICCDLTVANVLKEKTAAYRETLLNISRRFLADAVTPGLGLLGIFEEPSRIVTRLKWLELKTWENRKRKIAATIFTILVTVVFVMPMSGRSQLQETNEVRNEKMKNPEKIPVPPVINADLMNRTASPIEYIYGPLFENIEVSSEKLEMFKELLTDETMALSKINEMLVDVHMTQEKIDEMAQRTSNVVEEYKRKIAELIGDEPYSKFVTYRDRLLESQQVDSFNMNQPEKETLAEKQREKLVVAMYQARLKIPGKIESLRDISNQVVEAYLDSAKPILSESQLENFHNFLLNEQKQFTPETSSTEDVSPVPMESISDSQDGITLNMVDTDITVMIETISKMTGKTFIIDSNVKGKVTLVSPEKLSPVEAYRLFESALEVNGFALVPAGNVIKVVPVSTATPAPATTRISLRRAQVENALENKSELLKQLVFTSFSENDLKGVLASNLKANSLWRRMGLRNGDVLVTVDDQPLTTVDQMAAFF